ncbi:ABC transporter ATP-binding protein [Deinococcus irradiatisoli]|uniref:ABC transporter ATP-binding protein n=1 Tax=Deinococcus irradiatisoli TaxID=2202254 RepID=A0A2Z3JH00_9DEIO|nr:ABC-F family ATP-binding cassette domain-containing protein [Deinococcus irradiatisoli]AWN22630.1 ABC transporter ATP-binding protein [Deinococcus irradiatisoli]
MPARLHHVARIYGDQLVFEDVSLELRPHDRLALIGANGSGKTTLLRLLAGLDTPDAGQVEVSSAAYLPQHAPNVCGTVLQAVTPPELQAAFQVLSEASAHLVTPTPQVLGAFSAAEDTYRALGGYDFETRAAAVLGGLDLDAHADVQRLSGGQARRVLLARLLLSPAELYLLDEPTNHLDEASLRWLESWIAGSRAAFVLASHDRAFLDAVSTRTAELERGELTVYPGAYSAAMELKATLREAQGREYAAFKRKRAALEEEQRRQASKGRVEENRNRARDNDKFLSSHKAGRAQQIFSSRARAMQKQIERLDAQATDKPFEDRRILTLELPAAPTGPAEVLTVRDLAVCRNGAAVLGGVNLDLRRGDKVALTGPNGAGKSSLLLALLGRLPHRGTVRLGAGLSVYFAGQTSQELADLPTLKDALLDANPQLTLHQLYEIAAQVGLPPDPAFRVADLSGGQRTRLTLARLGVTRAGLLILDEPTNHLDVRAIEALEGLLQAFPGTVLLATHDRRLRERVATRVWEVGDGSVREG